MWGIGNFSPIWEKVMKRVILLAAAVLFAQAAIAQDMEEPSEESVLDKARDKYWQDQQQSDSNHDADLSVNITVDVRDEEPGNTDTEKNPDQVPYTPFLISFVPALSVPFGYYDVSFAAGAVGTMTRDVTGAEGSGVFNMARDVRGFQGAGVFNMARKVKGFQAAGVFNMAEDLRGAQAAGVFNIAHDVSAPVQAAGVFNLAEGVHGFQVAGVFNIADDISGGQVAGVFNIADTVKGVQIGIVNIADEIDGMQFGLINIAGNGVNNLGILYEPDTGWFFAQWQSGSPRFFSTLGLAAQQEDWFVDLRGFSLYAGLGTRAHVLSLNIDAEVYAVQPVLDLPLDESAWEYEGSWRNLRPYPALRLTAGLPLFGSRSQLVGGVYLDIEIDSLGERVPEARKIGESWTDCWFGERFTVWPKWFFGVKF